MKIYKLAISCKASFYFLLLAYSITTFSFENIENLIANIDIDKNKATFALNAEFKNKYLTEDFFVEYDEDIDLTQLDESIVTIPLIAHIISIIWASGKKYQIEAMDSEYFKSLQTIKKIFKKMYPKTSWSGELIPKNLVDNQNKQVNGQSYPMALLFSGGVDATFTSMKYRDTPQLLITIFGNLELDLANNKLIEARKQKVKEYAQGYNHQNSFIKSNFVNFIDYEKLALAFPRIGSWRYMAIEDLGWTGICAPIVIYKNIPQLYISSHSNWKVNAPSAGNVFIDHNIKFAGTSVVLYSQDFTRMQKINFLTRLQKNNMVNKLDLHVCKNAKSRNCCRCEKCVTTAIELLAANSYNLQDFGFNTSLQSLKKQTEKLLQTKKFWPVDYFNLVVSQNRIKNKFNRGLMLTDFEKWFANYDLTKNQEIYTSKFNWQMLNEFAVN